MRQFFFQSDFEEQQVTLSKYHNTLPTIGFSESDQSDHYPGYHSPYINDHISTRYLSVIDRVKFNLHINIKTKNA